MPDIDRTAEIKVHDGLGMVVAEIPLAGHASEYWLFAFRPLAAKLTQVPMWKQEPGVEADNREDRTWIIVRLAAASNDLPPEPALDAVSALIAHVNGMEQLYLSGAGETAAAVRGWWARQQR